MPEAPVGVFLLNVMGSAAVASAIIVGVMTTRLSREIAGAAAGRSDLSEHQPSRDDPSP